MRGVCLNPNKFSVTDDDTKYHQFFSAMRRYKISFAMLQECGIQWDVMPREQRFINIAKRILEPHNETCKVHTAHNESHGVTVAAESSPGQCFLNGLKIAVC